MAQEITIYTKKEFQDLMDNAKYNHTCPHPDDGFTFKLRGSRNYKDAKFVYRKSLDFGQAIFIYFPPEHSVRYFVCNGSFYDLLWKINDLAFNF